MSYVNKDGIIKAGAEVGLISEAEAWKRANEEMALGFPLFNGQTIKTLDYEGKKPTARVCFVTNGKDFVCRSENDGYLSFFLMDPANFDQNEIKELLMAGRKWYTDALYEIPEIGIIIPFKSRSRNM